MENKEYIVHVAVRPSLLRQINQRLGGKAPRGRYSSENTIFVTASFPDGCEMDIKCCGYKGRPSSTKAVLFSARGMDFRYSEARNEFTGEWTIEYNGATYTAIVEEGQEPAEKKKYTVDVPVPSGLLHQINNWLNTRKQEEFQGENVNASVMAAFPDGCTMEILCRGCKDTPSWTEAVLRNARGEKLLLTGQGDVFTGTWTLVNGGNTYTAIVTEG